LPFLLHEAHHASHIQRERRCQVLSKTSASSSVTENDKQRFTLSADSQQIRASPGHSIAIDLPPADPSEFLYHGTALQFVNAILRQGLRPGRRQHVHLSAHPATATNVGRRRGQPVVLTVRAADAGAQPHLLVLSKRSLAHAAGASRASRVA
jgi:RNA:NAD 2'-phosphotransferase (TPT1/KptA family)